MSSERPDQAIELDLSRRHPSGIVSGKDTPDPLEVLVDLILEAAVLGDAEALLSRVLKGLQPVFPRAAAIAHLDLTSPGRPRTHPASWNRGGGVPAPRELALSRFKSSGKSLLLPVLEPGPVSVILAPLASRGRLSGVLYLESEPGAAPFQEGDLRLVAAAAMALAIGLDNSQLYAELLSSLELNEGILQGLGSGVLTVDAAGIVRKVNAAGLEGLGLAAGEALRRRLADLPVAAPLLPLVQRVLRTGERLERHEVELLRDGERVPFGLTLVPLRKPSGVPDGVILNFRDLTQVHRLADLVRRGQQMAALGEMAAGVAHEIRNPLNAIRGFVEIILERTQGEDRRYMQTVVEEVERINHIVSGLLDFSRRQDLVMAPTDLQAVVAKSCAMVAAAAERGRVRLRNLVAAPCRIQGHAGKLEQVFLNLLQNAVEAMAEGGGDLTVSSAERTEGRLPGWAVAVADTGAGIAPEDLSRLFTPFFTLKEQGTGLGLAICHKIIEAHGGRIDVESRPGAGTTFSVWLPKPAGAVP